MDGAIPTVLLLLVLIGQGRGQSYEDIMSLFSDKLGGENYHPDVRPLLNQSDSISVGVSFELLSIVEVNDVTQSFVCNGFLVFGWNDQRVSWDPEKYGGQKTIHPLPEQIWRPRIILMNTLGDRDLFDDDKATVIVYYNGNTVWVPGGLFPSSCDLKMSQYPFDVQTCQLYMTAMMLNNKELHFLAALDSIGTQFATAHGEWDIVNTSVEVEAIHIRLKFSLRRRPSFLVINILLPIIFLSFLNLFVFVIPCESGEKIGYGITVLLALTVFMSMVSGMLPRSSITMPKLTIYLFILLVISMLTVIDSVFIMYLHHMQKEHPIHRTTSTMLKTFVEKLSELKRSLPMKMNTDAGRHDGDTSKPAGTPTKDSPADVPVGESFGGFGNQTSRPDGGEDKIVIFEKGEMNWISVKFIRRHIDFISFVVFFLAWLSVTFVFLVEITFA